MPFPPPSPRSPARSTSRLRPVAVGALLAGSALLFVAAPAAGKDAPAPPFKTGVFRLEASPPVEYILMAVPQDYDPKRLYPLAFLLHPETGDPEASKPEPFVGVWAEPLNKRGWIIASPKVPMYDNEQSMGPLQESLRRVLKAYRIDERRMVILGHNAGGIMGWRLATQTPKHWAGVMTLSAEIHESDRGALKSLAGKSAYIFRGEKDTYYTAPMLKADQRYLDHAGVKLTVFEKAGWNNAFPTPDVETLAAWVDGVYPPGGWKEKADAVQKAIAEQAFGDAGKALAAIAAELKKTPYPAFVPRFQALSDSLAAAVREQLSSAGALLDADPLEAVARTDAVVKALKGVKGLEDEAKKALAALQKSPAVVEAVKKKEAETAGASYMDKAAAAEAKGDLAQALANYRKAAALALFSRREEAAAKVEALQPDGGAK